jgi:hypothetical protein
MEPVVHAGVYTMQDRLDLIAGRVDASLTRPQTNKQGQQYMLRDLALEIVRGTPQHGSTAEDGQVSSVFSWTKANVEYRQDPDGYDEYRSAGRTINAGAGDCDDHVILNNSLLRALGFRTGARICSPDKQSWHIYGIVGVRPFNAPTLIYPFDTTQPGSYVGWEPPPAWRKYLLQCDFHGGKATGLRSIA